MSASISKFSRALLVGLTGLGGTLLVSGSQADAAEAPVGLGTAGSFAVLAGETVTNTGLSVISGDLGVSPGSAIVGFPPGIVNNGTIHAGNAVAAQAQSDVTTAYNDAAGRSPTTNVNADLGGQRLVAGVYRGPTLGLTGTVTLDAQNDSSAVFIFQAASTLITASNSGVSLVNGANACNVYWQVGSSATLGTTTQFVGTILALTSVTANNGATVMGRLLARTGAVTLDNNTINRGNCALVAPATTTTTSTPAATTTTSPPAVTLTTTPTGTAGTMGTPGTGGTGGTPTAAITSSGRGPRPTSSGGGGGGSGDSGDSSVTASRTPLANTGWQLTGAAGAGVLAILLGSAMLAASRPKLASGPGRRFRC